MWTYKVSNQDAVDELQRTDCNEKSHKAIQKLYSLRGLLDVFVPHALDNVLRIEIPALA